MEKDYKMRFPFVQFQFSVKPGHLQARNLVLRDLWFYSLVRPNERSTSFTCFSPKWTHFCYSN